MLKDESVTSRNGTYLKTHFCWMMVLALTKSILGAEFLQPIPYLYFSSNDSASNYIEFTKYYSLEGTINPALQASNTSNLILVQPFEFTNMSTPILPNKSLENCTAATSSNSEYGALVCNNNNFFVYSVNKTLATQDLNKIDNKSCIVNAGMLCQSAFIDLELALGFVTCLKNNGTSAGIQVLAMQMLDDYKLAWSTLCWVLPESADPLPSQLKAVVTSIDKRPLNNTLVQSLALRLVTASLYDSVLSPTSPKFIYNLEFLINVSNIKIELAKLKDVPEKIELAALYESEINLNLIDIVGAPDAKFTETFGASMMLVTMNPQPQAPYLSEFDIFFVDLDRSDGISIKPAAVKRVKGQFDKVTQILLDINFLYTMNVEHVDAGADLQLRRVDIFSFFNGFYTEKSAITCNTIEFQLELSRTTPNSTNLKREELSFDISVSLVSSPTLLAGIADLNITGTQEIVSYFLVWDLTSLSLKKIDSTGMKIHAISLSATNGEPLVAFPYFDTSSNLNKLGRICSSKAYIGVPNVDSDFNFQATLRYENLTMFSEENFNLTGTYIKDMPSFIQLPVEYFQQTFSYYTQLSYQIYLPWSMIRGVDITINPHFGDDDVEIFSVNLGTQDLQLGVDNVQPDIYFIKGDFLVLMTKNHTAFSVTIMIFKVQSVQTGAISYRSENNYTICMPGTGLFDPTLNVDLTQLRDVEVLFDNILTMVELVYDVGRPPNKKTYTNATLLSFYGPNYLKGNLSIRVEAPGFYSAIIPNIETVCYLVLCSSSSYVTPFLQVYNITMENMESSSPIAWFNQSSNIRPPFCPVQLFPDTIDNQYLIVVSSCPVPKGFEPKTYTMKLDLLRLVVSEYQKERVIDKSGNICPSSGSFVSINNDSITGYILPPGKSFFSWVKFYISDFNPKLPYQAVCYINKNLLVVSQTHQEFSPITHKVTLVTTSYVFSTDSTVDADRRMLQRVRLPDNIQKLTVSVDEDVVYLQPTSKDPLDEDLIRYVVYLKKKEVRIFYNSSSMGIEQKTAMIEFETLNRTTTEAAYKISFSPPVYSATLQAYPGLKVSQSDLNLSLIDNLVNITGPVYSIALASSSQNLGNPQLKDTASPTISDVWIDSKVAIRAPIFAYFDLFQGVGDELFVGIVNYPYGFDICVLDSSFLQYPQVTPIAGLNAMAAQTIRIDGKLYLFVFSSDLSDGYYSLTTYYSSTEDWEFSSAVSYVSPLFVGEMDVQLIDSSVPTFLVSFFSKQDLVTYFFLVNFRELNSDALADINPISRLINVAQVQLIARPDFDALFIIYRKNDEPSSLYYRVWETPSRAVWGERPVFENSTTFRGTNEKLRCSSFSTTIDCVMSIEGNYFVEVRMNITKGSFRPDEPYPVPTLICLETKQYPVYVNNKIERLDFSEEFIYAQTVKTLQSETDTSGPARQILLYRRDSNSTDLYKGIPCNQYSDTCNNPISLVPFSANQIFFASQTGMYLVQSLTAINRTLYLPQGFNFSSLNDLTFVVSNPFNTGQTVISNFTTLVKVASSLSKPTLYFKWSIGTLFISFPLLLTILALQKDLRERSYHKEQDDAVYFSSMVQPAGRLTLEQRESEQNLIHRRKGSGQTTDSEDEQKLPSGAFDGPTYNMKRNLAKSMRVYSYEEPSPMTASNSEQ